jgi:ABC-type nitrate/sulfonate/bicarbonate transport system substrate-binding protein
VPDASRPSHGSIRAAAQLIAALFVTLTLVVGVAGCGGADPSGTSTVRSVGNASLMLDFTPNAIHSGIYTALARGYDRAAGVDLHVVVPGESTDAIDVLDTGRVDFAILDIHDLAIADARGRKLVGLMAIVQRPLASVIAAPRFRSPSDLTGQTVGVTGDPSDLAVLHSVLIGAGVSPAKVHTLTIGYDAVPDLLAGRIAAATAFWNDEGVQLREQRKGFRIFRVEDYGAPPYPELVLCATSAEVRAHPARAAAVVHALQRGYRAAATDPTAAVRALTSRVGGLNASSVRAQLNGELPALHATGSDVVGALPPAVLDSWARWEQRFGIVKRRPDVATMFTSRFLDQEIHFG